MKILFFFFISFIFISSAYAYNFTYNGMTARLDAVGVQNISQDVLTTGCLNGSIPQYSSSDSLWACRGASNDAVLVGNNLGTGYDQPALPNCTDAGGNHLNYTAATNNFSCGSTSSGGAGAIIFPRISEDDVALVSGDVINYTTGIKATNPIGTRINVSGDMTTTTAPGIASFDTNSFSIGPSNGGVSIRTGGASGDVQFAMGANRFGGASGVSWDNAAMRFATSVSLDMSGIPASAIAGFKLPLTRTNQVNVSADGQMIWNVSRDGLYVGTGSITKNTKPPKEYWWPASATLPLEAAADSIPPISKTLGTNMDALDVLFDSATDECRTVNFKVPSDVESGSDVTFRIHWRAPCTSCTTPPANNVIWDFRHNGGAANAAAPDAALTTIAAAASTAQTVSANITVVTWSASINTMNWVANDEVDAVFCRDADNVSDTVSYDAVATGFGVEIPRA